MTTNIFSRPMTWLSKVILTAKEQNSDNIQTTTIGDFLAPAYQRQFVEQITAVRALCPTLEAKLRNKERVRQLKDKLPAGIISGVAAGGIGQDNIEERNGVISIDIDAADNPAVHDWEALKREIGRLPYVAYVGLSVSALGIFALIPLRDPEKHKQHFDALVRKFAQLEVHFRQEGDAEETVLQGLVLDTAPSNIASKRFVSYDPAPIWKTETEVYEDVIDTPSNNKLSIGNLALGVLPLEPRPGMLRQSLLRVMSPLVENDLPSFDLEGFLCEHGIDYEVRSRQGGLQYIVRCPWEELHTSGHSYAESAIFRYSNGAIGYNCFHAHCQCRTWHDYRAFYEG